MLKLHLERMSFIALDNKIERGTCTQTMVKISLKLFGHFWDYFVITSNMRNAFLVDMRVVLFT